MRYDYVVTLKREQERNIDRISLLLCLLSGLAFLYEQIRQDHIDFFLSFAILVMLAGIVVQVIALKKRRTFLFRSWLLLAGIFWLGMPYLQWICVFFFFLAFLEYQAKYPLEVGFTRDAVVINTLFRKKYGWSEFNNIVLKDGLLTLDFRNNKIFQKEALDDDEPDADEDEFNDYCRSLLTARA